MDGMGERAKFCAQADNGLSSRIMILDGYPGPMNPNPPAWQRVAAVIGLGAILLGSVWILWELSRGVLIVLLVGYILFSVWFWRFSSRTAAEFRTSIRETRRDRE
jgi:hypothetical protein